MIIKNKKNKQTRRDENNKNKTITFIWKQIPCVADGENSKSLLHDKLFYFLVAFSSLHTLFFTLELKLMNVKLLPTPYELMLFVSFTLKWCVDIVFSYFNMQNYSHITHTVGKLKLMEKNVFLSLLIFLPFFLFISGKVDISGFSFGISKQKYRKIKKNIVRQTLHLKWQGF